MLPMQSHKTYSVLLRGVTICAYGLLGDDHSGSSPLAGFTIECWCSWQSVQSSTIGFLRMRSGVSRTDTAEICTSAGLFRLGTSAFTKEEVDLSDGTVIGQI